MFPAFASIVLMCASLLADTPAVPVASEPHHHLALQNGYVRVFKVEVPPHDATLVHHHAHDYVWVSIGAAQVTNAPQDKPAAQLRTTDGETVFTASPLTHLARNDGDTPFRNVTIEILKPKKDDPAKQAEARGLEAGHGAAVETLFVHDGVKVSDVILNPNAMLPTTQKTPPRLVVAVNPIRLRDHANARLAVDRQAGDIQWIPAGPSMLANVGDKPAHFVVLEFE